LRADRKASNGSLGGPFLFNVLPLDRTKLSGRFGQFGRTTPTVWNWPVTAVHPYPPNVCILSEAVRPSFATNGN